MQADPHCNRILPSSYDSNYMKLLKKYATIYRAYINTKKSQDSEILTKHFNFNHGSKLEEAAGFISPAATSLASII